MKVETLSTRDQVRQIWRETQPGLRRFSKMSYFFGGIFLVVGIAADVLAGPWDYWGFATNVLTSIVGFLFGVPVALIGLNAINERREHESDVKKAKALIHRTWTNFSDAVEKSCKDSLIDEPVKAATEVTAAWSTGIKAITVYVIESAKDEAALEVLRAGLTESADSMELALKNLEKALGNVGVLKHHWLRVRVNWETIRTTIRVSVAELDPDLKWLKDIHDTRLHYYLGTDTHPLLKVHSSKTKGTGENYRDFADEAPRALRQLALLDGRQFLRKFNAAVSIDSVVRLRSDAVTASAELKGFRETVREINDSPFVTQAIPKRAIVPSDGASNDQVAPPEDGVKPVESGEASERTQRPTISVSQIPSSFRISNSE